MFDHVTIRVSDRTTSRRFYELALGGTPVTVEPYDEWHDFSLAQAGGDRPPTRRLHVAFVTTSEAEVDAFSRRLTDAGYVDDGRPGPRPEYHEGYYGAFVLDPDGNNVEAVFHDRR